MSLMPDEKVLIKKLMDETVDSMIRVAAEGDLQKDITKRIKAETTISPRVFRKMARVAFNSSFAEEQAVNEEFETLYKEITLG